MDCLHFNSNANDLHWTRHSRCWNLDVTKITVFETQASLQRETSLYTRSEISQLQVFQKMFSKIQNHLLCTSPLLTSILPQSLMYPSYTAIHLPLFLMSVY